MLARKDGWSCYEETVRGGKILKYDPNNLSPEFQKALGGSNGNGSSMAQAPLETSTAMILVDQPLPFAPFSSLHNGDLKTSSENQNWIPEKAINPNDLEDPRFTTKLAVLKEADEMPSFWKKGRRAWIEAVGLKYGVHLASIYRWLEKCEGRDIAGLRHTKVSQGKAKSWDAEALEFWKGLILKREHRGIRLKNLYYDVMLIEAHRHKWKIGGYRSSVWWAQKINPLLKTLSRGGKLALDNALPPILRDYSDLVPFEILVGDQHRFDRWVVDDDTGEVIRQECYIWVDLKTGIIYGLAVDKKYDSWLMGLALRIGIRCYGAFQSIYTDNGKPECSHYLTSILDGMKSFGLTWEQTTNFPGEAAEVDGEEINPYILLPGSHRKAIVKNSKAKLIEKVIRDFEEIMESHFRLPGRTKRLTDDVHSQEVDEEEARDLAKAGKLLLASEHALMMYWAADYYNREKPHRRILKEWIWKPKPASATPYDCLKACYEAGWRPRKISEEAADLIFLARGERVVRLGRIELKGDFYEHEALIGIEGRVDLRFNPMDLSEILVFGKGKYLCTATPVEYSSMKDMDLAQRKIHEKRARAKRFSEDFKRLTCNIPDFRQYSTVPEAERVAALVGAEKKKRAAERAKINRPQTPQELESEIRKNEEVKLLPSARDQKPLPERPAFFHSEFDHFKWARDYRRRGGSLSEEELTFVAGFEGRMSPAQAEHWETESEIFARAEIQRGLT